MLLYEFLAAVLENLLKIGQFNFWSSTVEVNNLNYISEAKVRSRSLVRCAKRKNSACLASWMKWNARLFWAAPSRPTVFPFPSHIRSTFHTLFHLRISFYCFVENIKCCENMQALLIRAEICVSKIIVLHSAECDSVSVTESRAKITITVL